MPATKINIIRETVIPRSGADDQAGRLAAITYQLPPAPADVIMIPEDQLPDLVHRRQHPDGGPPPAALQAQGDKIRRERILDRLQRRSVAPARVI